MGGRSKTLMMPYSIYSLFTALCYVAEVEPAGLAANGAITLGNAFEGETSGAACWPISPRRRAASPGWIGWGGWR